MSTENDQLMRLVKSYSKALEQVSLLSDAVFVRVRNIERVMSIVKEQSPEPVA